MAKNKSSQGVCQKICSVFSGGSRQHNSSSIETTQNTTNPVPKKLVNMNQPKEIGTSKHSQDRVISIGDQNHGLKGKLSGGGSTEGRTKVKWRMSSMAKTKSTKEKRRDENKKIESKESDGTFTSYIDRVRNNMGVAPNSGGSNGDGGGGSGGGGGGDGVRRRATRRDSFTDEVWSYIKRTNRKIRTATNLDGKSNTVK